jgi:putative inorganic carbon (hco3(-)) transporter
MQMSKRHVPGRAHFWVFQSYVMIAIACSSFFPMMFRYQEHAVIILIMLCLGMCAVERMSPWIRNPLDLPLWLFMGWVLCTVPFAIDSAYSFAEWKKFVAQAGVFYWSLLVLDRCRREELPQQILRAVMVGGTILALYALVIFFDSGGTWRDRFVRAHGFGSDYNWLSTYMVMTIPVVCSLMVMGRVAWIRGTEILALSLTTGAQVFSYTRAGWLGHAAQGMALALMIGGRRLALAVLGLMSIAGVGLFVASQAGFQTDTVAAKTVDTRLTVWTIGLHEVSTHPVVGIGYGNNSFIKKFPEYSVARQDQLPEGDRIIPAMHNTFLMVTLGSGLPALGCFVWIFVSLIRQLIPAPWTAEPGNLFSGMAAGIGLAVIGFAVRNFFDYMFMGSLSHLFWLLAAVGITMTGPGWRLAPNRQKIMKPAETIRA